MLNTNLNITPYHDDFSLDKNYFRYLFKSGQTIQTRELNGLQSLLQSQIEKLGNYIFTEGSVVVPGHASADLDVFAIPLNNFINGVSVDSYIENLKNTIVTGNTTGIKAKIINILKSTDSINSVPTLYIKYISSSPEDNSLEFLNDELLLDSAGTPIASVAYLNGSSTKSILAKVTAGVYYARGLFIETEDQEIVVEQYSNTSSYKIGFTIKEEIINALDDNSLYDNAVGNANDTIAGADRLKITLVFNAIPLSVDSGNNFIELLRISQGNLVIPQKETVKSVINSELQKNLARRTYDESGDYVITDFTVSAKNTLNNFKNNGLYKLFDYTSNGKQVFSSDTGLETDINGKAHYTLDLSAGKAYVKGFEIEKNTNSLVEVLKPNQTESSNNNTTILNGGSYLVFPDIDEAVSTTAYEKIYFKNDSAVTIGEAVALGITEGNHLHISNLVTYSLLVVSDGTGITAKGKVIGDTSGASGFIESVDTDDLVLSGVKGTFISGESLTFTNFSATPTVSSFTDYSFSQVATVYKSNETTLIADYASETPQIFRDSKYRFAPIVEKNNTVVNDLSYYYVKTFAYSGAILDNSEPFLGTGILVDSSNNRSTDVTIASNGAVSGDNGWTGTIYAKVLKGSTTLKTKTARLNRALLIDSDTLSDFYGTRYNDSEICLGVPDVYNVLCVREVDNTGNLLTTFSSIDLNDASNINIGDVIFGKDSQAVGTIVHKTSNKIYFVERNTSKFINGELVYSLSNDSLTNISTTSDLVEGYYNDITTNYVLEKGINEDTYSISKLTLKKGYAPASSAIVVIYSYREHGGTGDYFTISSYNGDYEQIGDYEGFNFSDIIDFRATTTDTLTGTGTLTSPFTLEQTEALNKTTRTYSFTNFVYPGSILTFDHTYYLPRIDKLYLRSDGQFGVSRGEYSLNPKPPKVPENSLLLYLITYPSYVRSVNDILFKGYKYRRYTMKDIGAIDRRLENVEYYTSLNLLEVETANLNILDDSNLNRFKNGFIVDAFNSPFSITADYSNPQFRSSIDSKNKELRPEHFTENTLLEYLSQSGLKLTNDGKRVTLDFVETSFINQGLASRVENLNPFGAFEWNGVINLIPSTDIWVETERVEPLELNVEGNFSEVARNTDTSVNWAETNSWVTTDTDVDVDVDVDVVNVSRTRRDTITTRTTTTTTEQERFVTGTQNILRESIQTDSFESLLSSQDILRVRRQYVKVQGSNLRPSTGVDLYINNIDMTPHRLSTRLEIENINGTFNGTDGISFFRTIEGVETLIATAKATSWDSVNSILEYDELRNPFGDRVANILDVIPKPGDKLLLLGSSAFGNVKTEINSTSEDGNYSCFVLIPFNTFDTGNLEFLLLNSTSQQIGTTTALSSSSTRASSVFPVAGTLNTVQETIVSTRNAVVDQISVSRTDTRTITDIDVNVNTVSRRIDPLAQSFFIELEEGSTSTGVFLTSIDIFFASVTSDDTSQVKLTIRTVENGIPTNKIIPFSTVTKKPSDINTSEDGSVATNFEFDSPVYLKNGYEYCFVVEPGSSTDYNVFVGRLGETDLVSGNVIDKQPYIGSLYKSQNQSVWEPSQFEDMKFRIYKADFKTPYGSSPIEGTLTLKNEKVRNKRLNNNPLEFTSGNATVRIYQPNHGMHRQTTNSVILSGIKSNIPNGILQSSIPSGEFTSQDYTINNVTNFPASGDLKIGQDIYSYTRSGTTFTLTTYAPSSAHNSGEIVECYVLNGISLRDLNDVEKVVTSVDGLDYYYVTASQNASSNLKAGGSQVFAGRNVQYSVITPSVETLLPDSTNVSIKLNSYTGTSIFYKNSSGTEDPFVSVSENRFIENRKLNFLPTPRIIASEVNADNNTSGNPTLTLDIKLTSDDSNVSPMIDIERCFVLTTDNRINYDLNVDDTLNTSETSCSYVTKQVSLKTPATSAKVFLDAVRYENNEVECYVKMLRVDDNTPFNEIEYVKLPLVSGYPVSGSYNDFKELSFELNDQPLFSAASFKVVLKSKSQANIPRVKRFRGILLT